jgi:DNA excision repair protein ERCC-5
MDPDLRQYQREMALSAIDRRHSPKKLALLPKKPIFRKDSKPLFDLDADDEDAAAIRQVIDQSEDEDDEDEQLAFAIQASLDQAKYSPENRASGSTPMKPSSSRLPHESPRSIGFPNGRRTSPEVEIFAPSGLETALSFAGTGSRSAFGRPTSGLQERSKSTFGTPSLLSASPLQSTPSDAVEMGAKEFQPGQESNLSPKEMPLSTISGFRTLTDSEGEDEMEEVDVTVVPPVPPNEVEELSENMPTKLPFLLLQDESEEDEDMEEVEVIIPEHTQPARGVEIPPGVSSEPTSVQLPPFPEAQAPILAPPASAQAAATIIDSPTISLPSTSTPDEQSRTPLFVSSRSPSPAGNRLSIRGFGETTATAATFDDTLLHGPVDMDGQEGVIDEQPEEEHWDAANEMDPHIEEGEFARFLSQVKGRNLEDVRREIDDEIKVLNEQRKAAMRDSEDITQQMISQIMVSSSYGPPPILQIMTFDRQCCDCSVYPT